MSVECCHHWRAYIERALKRCNNLLTFDDILERVANHSLLWLGNGESFALVEPVRLSQTVMQLHVLVAGGTQKALYDLEANHIIPFAKEIGAKKITMMVRMGFLRGRLNEGWKAPCVYLEKML